MKEITLLMCFKFYLSVFYKNFRRDAVRTLILKFFIYKGYSFCIFFIKKLMYFSKIYVILTFNYIEKLTGYYKHPINQNIISFKRYEVIY